MYTSKLHMPAWLAINDLIHMNLRMNRPMYLDFFIWNTEISLDSIGKLILER